MVQVVQEIEKIMVFKEIHELPVYLKYIPEFIPGPREKVVVMEQSPYELKVKFGQPAKIAVLSKKYFRTVRRDQLREKLMRQPLTKAIEIVLKNI